MASARGEYWYFEDGVDANKITVPELRSILLTHGVSYPSSAKKSVLVALFNDVVLPQKAQVQRSQARTKRSTRGIVDVPSSSGSTVTTEDTEEEETYVAPQPSTVKRASRRTPIVPAEEVEGWLSKSKTPSRAIPAKHSRAPEPEVDERPPSRRTRKSSAPAFKEASPEPEAWHRTGVNSPFTQDNPFQSGSSPAVPDTASREHRRRTTGSEHQREKRKSDANRRRTHQPIADQLDEGIHVPTRKTFDMQDPRVKREQEQHDDDTYAGEEFTPEEQLELVRERAKAGEVDILPPPRRRQRSKATGTIKAMSSTILLTAAVVFGGVWRQEKIDVGFCGVGRESTQLAGVDVPEWANIILPQCEPCPPHAQCHRGLNLRCDQDFMQKDHPLSLGGLVPLPPTCEPDSEKTRKINSVANKAISVLRQRRAQYECGEPDADGQIVKDPFITEQDLRQELSSKKSKGLTNEQFNEIFDRAFPEAALREEVIESTNS